MSVDKKEQRNHPYKKHPKKIKSLAEIFPEEPEAMTPERLKSYPQFTHITEERAQNLIHQIKKVAHVMVSICDIKK